MLLKLDMNLADDAGNPIKTCSILKCHKQEGDRVDCGDPLFDLEVSEILIPSHLAKAWSDSRFLHGHSFEIADLETKPSEGQQAANQSTPQNGAFVFHKTSYRQVIALDKGFVRKVYAEKGTSRKVGDPMALLSTDEGDAINNASEPLPPVPACRVATRSLGLDLVLKRRTEAVAARSAGARQYVNGGSIILWSEEVQERRLGIFAKGGCDLPSIKACWPLIEKVLKGACCITHEGMISDARNDLLLQSLRTDLPWEAINEVISKLGLERHCFEPRVFQKSFVVDGPAGPEQFPMNVVILGSGSDLVRTLYRHRQHGFLVDPGTAWLEHVEDVLKDLSAVAWFRRNFVSIGKVTPEQYMENLSKVIEHVRQSNGAHVLVFNNLTVDPRGVTHNYQFVKNAETVRRLEFKLALMEVSRRLNVPIIDVDRIAKKLGVHEMLDMAHFPAKITLRIAEEIFGILGDLRVFQRGSDDSCN